MIYFPSTNHYPCLQVKGQPTWPLGAEFTIGRGLEAIAALVKVHVPTLKVHSLVWPQKVAYQKLIVTSLGQNKL